MDRRWEDGRAIYIQIMERIIISIISGEFAPGQKIPSVREYASEFCVNPNTMQRALYELEREGILASERNTGRFVTTDKSVIEKLRKEQADKAFNEFYTRMMAMGYSAREISDFFYSKSGDFDEALRQVF